MTIRDIPLSLILAAALAALPACGTEEVYSVAGEGEDLYRGGEAGDGAHGEDCGDDDRGGHDGDERCGDDERGDDEAGDDERGDDEAGGCGDDDRVEDDEGCGEDDEPEGRGEEDEDEGCDEVDGCDEEVDDEFDGGIDDECEAELAELERLLAECEGEASCVEECETSARSVYELCAGKLDDEALCLEWSEEYYLMCLDERCSG